jgi:hypothetical protein
MTIPLYPFPFNPSNLNRVDGPQTQDKERNRLPRRMLFLAPAKKKRSDWAGFHYLRNYRAMTAYVKDC